MPFPECNCAWASHGREAKTLYQHHADDCPLYRPLHGHWVAVDLDGTLAHYDTWKGPEHIGAPVPAMVAMVRDWITAGCDVRIFTARVDGGEVAEGMGNEDGQKHRDVIKVRGYIEDWCLEHVGLILRVTNVKDFGMTSLWDDRAVQVVPNAGVSIVHKVAEALSQAYVQAARGRDMDEVCAAIEALDVSAWLREFQGALR